MADPKKYLSKIVKGSDTLWLKDSEARDLISDIQSSITGGMHYLGKSTTPIADGDATGPWVIDGVTYVISGAVAPQKNLAAGDIAIYGELEFIWSGASGKWQEFGSTGSLKALAFKDSASGSYTPAGTNAASAVSFSGQTDGDFVTGLNDDYVAPSLGNATTGNFVTGYNNDAVAPSLGEASTGSFVTGFDVAPALPTFTEGAYTPASYSHSGFSGGSLGAATTGNFNTDAEKSSYDETSETLTLSAASTGAAVTAQGDFTPAVYGTDTFDGGSKAADTFTQGTAPTLATGTAVTAQGTFSAGSAATLATSAAVTAQGTFSAGSPATVATSKAITAVGTGTAAAQVFSGTQATITVE